MEIQEPVVIVRALCRTARVTWLARIAAVLLLVVAAGCATTKSVQELTIFHVNDLHARFEPDVDGRGGFAHLATLLERERQRAGAHLTLDGGDMVQGSPLSSLFQGTPVFEIANHLGIDVSAPGNHEFDYGWQKLAEFTEIADFDLISANVVNAVGDRLFEHAYVIRSVGGLRIGIIGAMTEEFDAIVTSPHRGPWHSVPIVASLRPIVESLRQETDLVIVLGHISLAEQERVLEALPDVAIVVGGHEHRGRQTAFELDGRLAVSVAAYGRDLGKLEIRYDRSRRRIESYRWQRLPVLAREQPADPEVQRLVDQWDAKIADIVDVPIGRAERAYGREDLQRLVESAMTDATGVPIAYADRGWIRDDLPAGTILARHVWNLMPFDDEIVVVQFPSGELPQELAQRAELKADPSLPIATADYEANRWLDRGLELKVISQDLDLRDVIIQWIRRHGILQ